MEAGWEQPARAGQPLALFHPNTMILEKGEEQNPQPQFSGEKKRNSNGRVSIETPDGRAPKLSRSSKTIKFSETVTTKISSGNMVTKCYVVS